MYYLWFMISDMFFFFLILRLLIRTGENWNKQNRSLFQKNVGWDFKHCKVYNISPITHIQIEIKTKYQDLEHLGTSAKTVTKVFLLASLLWLCQDFQKYELGNYLK